MLKNIEMHIKTQSQNLCPFRLSYKYKCPFIYIIFAKILFSVKLLFGTLRFVQKRYTIISRISNLRKVSLSIQEDIPQYMKLKVHSRDWNNLTTESPLKIMERYFHFCPRFLVMSKNGLIRKLRLISKCMTFMTKLHNK